MPSASVPLNRAATIDQGAEWLRGLAALTGSPVRAARVALTLMPG